MVVLVSVRAVVADLGDCSVTDGSRESKDKRGYKNSLHLVFRKSPVCPQPTSNASAPDYPPLLAAQQVHSTLDVQDSKGAKQPDIGVYTTRRNMRLVGSCSGCLLIDLQAVSHHYLSIYLSIYLPIYLSIYLSIYPSIHQGR